MSGLLQSCPAALTVILTPFLDVTLPMMACKCKPR